MSQERTEAIVVRGVDFSETSRIVTLLTPARGPFACIAKGVRRKNSPLAPVLDTLNRLEIVYYWKDGRSVQQLAEATLLDGFDAVKASLEKVTYAAFPLEVASKAVHENEPSQQLYATFVRGMTGLGSWTGEVRAHACWQAVQILRVAGFEPALDACGLCGGAITDRSGFSYDAGATCPACRADLRLAPEMVAALRALVHAADACPPLETTGVLFRALSGYAARQLDTDLRSARVIQEMFGH